MIVQLLPAISFDNRRIKQKAWSSMLRAMDRAKAMKEFGGPRDHRLLGELARSGSLPGEAVVRLADAR